MYKIQLREDMPEGFKENAGHPWLPAAYEFLQGVQTKTYASREEVRAALHKFHAFITKKDIPMDEDRDMHSGIHIFDDNTVGLFTEGMAGRCEFGKLERVVEETAKK